jgi:transposase
MNPPGTFVGIDVCKARLDVHVLPEDVALSFANTAAGLKKLIKRLTALSPELVVFEPTGGLEQALMTALHDAQLPLRRENAARIRDLAKSINRVKTDALDAYVIALYGQLFSPAPQARIEESHQELKDLVRRRSQLLSLSVAEQNRLARASELVKADIQAHLEEIQVRVKRLDQQIQTLAKRSPSSQRRQTLITSVPGIADVTAAVLQAELPELGQLSHKQIARLVGVAPINRDSGKFRGKRSIFGGRTSVRCGLYMPTLVAIRHNPVIRSFY